MAALHHPNVVTIFDCGQSEGRYFLIMEYVNGPPLRTYMPPGQPWPIDRAAPMLDAIAQALSYIHEQGILHLDLKPENVLLEMGNGEWGPGSKSSSFPFPVPRSSFPLVKITDLGWRCGGWMPGRFPNSAWHRGRSTTAPGTALRLADRPAQRPVLAGGAGV